MNNTEKQRDKKLQEVYTLLIGLMQIGPPMSANNEAFIRTAYANIQTIIVSRSTVEIFDES